MKRTLGALSLLFLLGGVLLTVASPSNGGVKFGPGGSEWTKYRYTDEYYIEHGVEEVGGDEHSHGHSVRLPRLRHPRGGYRSLHRDSRSRRAPQALEEGWG